MKPSETPFGRERGRVHRRQNRSVWLFVALMFVLNVLMVYVLLGILGPQLATAPHAQQATALISLLIGSINLAYCYVFFKGYALRRQRDNDLRRHPLRQPPLTN